MMVVPRRTSNPALLPGSLLPYRDLFQQCADSLPVGTVLIVLPAAQTSQRTALETTARQLQVAGQRVHTIVQTRPHGEPGIQAPLPLLGS